MDTLPELEKRLKTLEIEIAEAQARLPAHSVKPAVMHMLLELEDEYDRINQQIAQLKRST